ncbi:hypothetical protein PV327_008868 [Microctonus hyperodae]|uniref:Uncharacterized protein n=1 Tax=Microctonus hyperodae TaxID=165561 RepID=A0AA39FSL7_MICHY|nr:hypothetical protein PV327_008868 [Microctonus hyperodae]
MHLKVFATTFDDVLENKGVNNSSRNPDVYTTSYILDAIMVKALPALKNNNIRKKFINAALGVFESILLPINAPVFYTSYMLVSKYIGMQTRKNEYMEEIFALVPKFIKIFTADFLFTFSKILIKCLEMMWPSDSRANVHFEIIKGLSESNNEHIIMLAFTIPIYEKVEQEERYLFKNLLKKNLSILSIFEEFIDEESVKN